jgi:hypothetical protein
MSMEKNFISLLFVDVALRWSVVCGRLSGQPVGSVFKDAAFTFHHGTDRLTRNAGNKLLTAAALHPRKAKTSPAPWLKPKIA